MVPAHQVIARARVIGVSIVMAAAFNCASATVVSQEILDDQRDPAATLLRVETALKEPRATGHQGDLADHLLAMECASSVGNKLSFATHLAKARELADSTQDAFGEAAIAALHAQYLADFGSPDDAQAKATQAFDLARNVKDELSQAYVRETAAWGMLGGNSGRYLIAQPHLQYALKVYTEHGQRLRAATARAGLGRVYIGMRNAKDAYSETVRAFDEVRGLGAPYFAALTAYQAAMLALHTRDLKAAKSLSEESLALGEQTKDTATIAGAHYALGRIAVAEKRWADAAKLLLSAAPELHRLGYEREYSIALAALARAEVGLGRTDVSEIWRGINTDVMSTSERLIHILGYQADTYQALNRPADAARLYQQLLEQSNKMFDDAMSGNLAELAARYQLDSKEAELERVRLAGQVADANDRASKAKLQLTIGLLALAVTLVGLVGFVAVTLFRSGRNAKKLAMTDVGTGAPNRRAILEALSMRLAKSNSFMLAILDLDHFKRVNDTWGHAAGDEVLRVFYQTAAREMATGEMLGRIGGEEWLLLFDRQDALAVDQTFKRLRSALQQTAIAGLPSDKRITFSMGATVAHRGEDVSEALSRADAALYEAKEAGRDQYRIAVVETDDDRSLHSSDACATRASNLAVRAAAAFGDTLAPDVSP